MIFVGSGIWGSFIGISNPSLETIFADSVSSGKRSHIFAIKHLLMQVGLSFGPFLTVLLFATLGDNWTFSQLQMVNCIGVSL